jgi:hypothetical protein
MNINTEVTPDDTESGFSGALDFILDKDALSREDMLPAIIISYNRATNRAVVRPLIKQILADGIIKDRSVLMSIPILQLGGNGFMLAFNLVAGNLGWIKANDRDISLFLQNYQSVKPNTYRIKKFSDGVFIPDVMTGYSVASGDTATLQSLDGTIKVALNSSTITLQNGASSIVLTPTGVAITSTMLTHNGVNISDTHVHPQGADSGGNTEQDTGYPE